jgi:DNA-directed RNA polymerase I subunit RPA2
MPRSLEIAYLPPTVQPANAEERLKENFFPGIFLSSQCARFVRPVRNLDHGGIELIGPLEQVNLSIAVQEEDLRSDSTHQELDTLNMLSVIASTIPFADYNQSPRNMY